ncbi:MAG: hypothetical protein KDC98_23580 [Planctomycetes bacterium]|nr:hypothetical protein [Planctomycetota bacterium]
MNRLPTLTAAIAAAAGLAPVVRAQQCYSTDHQCFVFGGRPMAAEGDPGAKGLLLQSDRLKVTGDIRFRGRASDKPDNEPYANANDQQTTRARLQFDFQATEKVRAFLEVNYSEVWGGGGSYSDSRAGAANNPNFDGISQAYVEADDMFGLGDKWVVGRSEYVLGNGLVLGSCDFLQRPATFTGAWLSRNFFGHDVEVFVLDDYGPLQSTHDPVRYCGATARIDLGGPTADLVKSVRPHVLKGTNSGDVESKDTWYGVDIDGTLPGAVNWKAEYGFRERAALPGISAFRVQVSRQLDCCGGFFESASLTYSDSEGAMHINPADFNSAGLLHQYGGAWRSDIATTQLAINTSPGWDLDLDINLLHLERRGSSAQEGEYEADVILARDFPSGVNAGIGYGIDDESRQVAYFLLSVHF